MKNFLGFLGLCRRAGKTVCGTPLVCIRLSDREKPHLVLYTSEASAATKKKITTKCAYYGVPAREIAVSPEALAAALGKGNRLCAVAVTDRGFSEAIEKKLKAPEHK